MKREYLLLAAATLISLGIGLFILKAFEPRLFKKPADLQVVRLDKAVPPFYENVFRDVYSTEFQISDPVTVVRGRTLFPEVKGLGPHDILGFRNAAVPVSADVVVIGDSQTYGNNSLLRDNWPSVMARTIEPHSVYTMSSGGWSAPQYLAVARHALAFRPKVIVVALYTGNDALESFRTVYSVDYWRSLRKDLTVSLSDMPESIPEDEWSAEFPEGKMVFTPGRRFISNDPESPAVRTGYEIMREVVKEISGQADVNKVSVFYTVVPTKELVFAPRVAAASMTPSAEYQQLIAAERKHIGAFRDFLGTVRNAGYIDVSSALEGASSGKDRIYPPDQDGHPLPAGYLTIGNTIGRALIEHLN